MEQVEKFQRDYCVEVKYDGIRPILFDELAVLNKLIEKTYGAEIVIADTSQQYVSPHLVEVLDGYVPSIILANVTKYGIFLEIEIHNRVGYNDDSIKPKFINTISKWADKNKLIVNSFTSIRRDHSRQFKDTFGVSVSLSFKEKK